MAWHEALDLEYWFVNVLSGSQDIFTFLAFIIIASMAAYFRMINSIILIMFVLFVLIMSAFITPGLYLIAILLGGLLASLWISKIIKVM